MASTARMCCKQASSAAYGVTKGINQIQTQTGPDESQCWGPLAAGGTTISPWCPPIAAHLQLRSCRTGTAMGGYQGQDGFGSMGSAAPRAMTGHRTRPWALAPRGLVPGDCEPIYPWALTSFCLLHPEKFMVKTDFCCLADPYFYM